MHLQLHEALQSLRLVREFRVMPRMSIGLRSAMRLYFDRVMSECLAKVRQPSFVDLVRGIRFPTLERTALIWRTPEPDRAFLQLTADATGTFQVGGVTFTGLVKL